MDRPSIDVVVPFAGSAAAFAGLLAALSELRRRPGDTLTVVDNRAAAARTARRDGVLVLRASERRSSYFARNRGARKGEAPWLVFLDADVRPRPELLDAYFELDVPDDAGVIAGGLVDEDAGDGEPLAARFAAARRPMAQHVALSNGYALTANCAVRRAAFEAVGGFAEDVRSGGDADLCFRLAGAGWGLEYRPDAFATHANRDTLAALLRQRARHGAGAAWLEARYPGRFPARGPRGMLAWTARDVARAARELGRGEREEARHDLVELAAGWAFELGRLLPNSVPKGPGPFGMGGAAPGGTPAGGDP
jgi:glycosyltransferase involved in cell wall biosynthesis